MVRKEGCVIMAFYNENGSYAYDYTDPEYQCCSVSGGRIRYLPEHYCPRMYWSAYTYYLSQLSALINDKRNAMVKSIAWKELCHNEEYLKLCMFGLEIHARLMQSAMDDARIANLEAREWELD